MRKEHGGRLQFVDASDPAFDPSPYGISLDAFMYQMHAIDRAGRVYRGVEAFWAIWQAFPASTLYGLLGKLVTIPGLNLCARLAYRGFARIRGFLPRRREACEGGSCRIGRR
jgi:predicted DCC family thiol-disulfide oxidoreductase YuxK